MHLINGGDIMLDHYNILTILVFALDLWAIINTISSGRSAGEKTLWVLLVLLLPIIGFLIWLFFGPKSGKGRIS